ncbi:unnamed protein product [Allacma fusca]|uniref:Uncharacterized protein n=1 Tax=Allacma fusca TaxID=39272 RepID=A0A8J2PBX0_9HEXA|nr:unnamed protein product [Allacma fusca]
MLRLRPKLRVTVTSYEDRMEETSAGSGSESSGRESSCSSVTICSPSNSFLHDRLTSSSIFQGRGSCSSTGESSSSGCSHHHLSIHHHTPLLTLDWTEASRNKHRVVYSGGEESSPISPSRNYQERLILPLG